MQFSDIDGTIGSGITKMLSTPVLVLAGVNGKDAVVLTRIELAKNLGVSNMTAASRLSAVLKKLGVKTVKQLEAMGPSALYRVKGVGHIQVYVAMCLLDAHHVDVHAWWGWDTKGATVLKHAREKKKRGSHDLTPAPRALSLGA